jgi:hypothetical protein
VPELHARTIPPEYAQALTKYEWTFGVANLLKGITKKKNKPEEKRIKRWRQLEQRQNKIDQNNPCKD